MKLTRLRVLTLTTCGTIDATEMTQCGCKSQTIQSLGDTGLDVTVALYSPIPCGERVTEAVGDCRWLDCFMPVDLLACLNL